MLFLKLPLTFVDLTVVFPLVCNVTVQMGSLQLGDHVVQNRQTGEQMRHWDMLNKENSNFVAFFKHVPVRHLFSSLYHVIAQMQMARVEEYIFGFLCFLVEGNDANCYVGTVVGILNRNDDVVPQLL